MAMETVKIGKLLMDDEGKQPQKSLDPLAENFDFDTWAKIVKKQMKRRLYSPFSTYLPK